MLPERCQTAGFLFGELQGGSALGQGASSTLGRDLSRSEMEEKMTQATSEVFFLSNKELCICDCTVSVRVHIEG